MIVGHGSCFLREMRALDIGRRTSPSVSLQTDCRRNHPRPNAAAQGPMADTVGNKTSIVANTYAYYVFV